MGVATVDLYLEGIHGLKEKRGIVRRVLERTRHRFPVSVAEVDSLDLHQKATIGFAVVSNDARLADSILNKVIDYVEELHLAEITRADLEILHV
ncbi:MAG: DUF503 domain-containing protein [Deferrisomatales bacterium]|nr:DUF503 domain-containing protein [Deferrisomatales bacterium]